MDRLLSVSSVGMIRQRDRGWVGRLDHSGRCARCRRENGTMEAIPMPVREDRCVSLLKNFGLDVRLVLGARTARVLSDNVDGLAC